MSEQKITYFYHQKETDSTQWHLRKSRKKEVMLDNFMIVFGLGQFTEESSIHGFSYNPLFDKNVLKLIKKFLTTFSITTKQKYLKRCETLMNSFQIKDIGNFLGANAVVSGSCLWYVLTANDEHKSSWFPADVDVYCLRKQISPLREYLSSRGYVLDVWKTVDDASIYNSDVHHSFRLGIETWVLRSYARWCSVCGKVKT